jgi:hypothetical protein
MSKITLSRAEREMILGEVWHWIPERWGADPLPFDTREEAKDSLRRHQRGIELLDELGWEDDDPREVFTVTVDAALVEVIRKRAGSAAEDIKSEIQYRERYVIGGELYKDRPMWAWDYASIEAAHAAINEHIKDAEELQRMCGDLVARMDAQAVVA